MMSLDLWPEDITTVAVKSPATILREQALKLGGRTNGVITATVASFSGQFGHETLIHHFRLSVPLLSNYRYKLFSIAHDVSDMYPIYLLTDDELLTQVATADDCVDRRENHLKMPTI